MRKLLLYGDSNTYGYDPRGFFAGRYDDDKIWSNVLAKMLNCGNDAGMRYEIINCGMNGRQLPATEANFRYLTSLLENLSEQDLFVILLGTNDILLTLEPDAQRPIDKMDKFLSWFLDRSSHPGLLVVAPPHISCDHTADPLYREYNKGSITMNAGFKELAEKYGVRFADAATWGVEMSFDGVHFSETGHQTFADNMIELLTTFL